MKVLLVLRGQGRVPGRAGVPGGQIGMAKIAVALTHLAMPVQVFIGGPCPKYLSDLAEIEITTMPWPLALDGMIAAAPSGISRVGASLRRRIWKSTLASILTRISPDVVHVQGIEDGETLLGFYNGPTVITHWGRSAARWKFRRPVLSRNQR